jgi:hypothetical protein
MTTQAAFGEKAEIRKCVSLEQLNKKISSQDLRSKRNAKTISGPTESTDLFSRPKM